MGHGHGGHGGGGHHHGGGGRRPGGWSGGWGPGWTGPGVWYNDPQTVIVAGGCPGTFDPVIATDGRVYNNPCEAQAAGYAVVRRVNSSTLSGVPVLDSVANAIRPTFGTATTPVTVGIALGAAYLLWRALQKPRSMARSRR